MTHCHHTPKTENPWIKPLIALLVGLPLFVMGLTGKATYTAYPSRLIWVGIGIAVLVLMIWVGGSTYKAAWQGALKGQLGMNSLIAVGTIPAWAYSLYIAIWPLTVAPAARVFYFDTPLMVLGVVGLGHALENVLSAKAWQVNTNLDLFPIGQKIAAWLTPLVFFLAVFTGIVWFELGPTPQGSHALLQFMAVLLIACPCALNMAVPIALKLGLLKLQKAGVAVNSEADWHALADHPIVKHTTSIIKQNLWFSVLYNAIAIPLAAGVLYPWTHTLIHPVVAGLMMAGSSVVVVLNAARV